MTDYYSNNQNNQYDPYGQPQYGQPQYGQPQYGQPQYEQPQYAQYAQPGLIVGMDFQSNGGMERENSHKDEIKKSRAFLAFFLSVLIIFTIADFFYVNGWYYLWVSIYLLILLIQYHGVKKCELQVIKIGFGLAVIRLIFVIIDDIIVITFLTDDDYLNCNQCYDYYYNNGNYYCYSYNNYNNDGEICYTSGTVAWIWVFFVFYTLVSILVVINYKRLKDGLEDYHVKKGDHYRHEGF